jgi:hypothetical protein
MWKPHVIYESRPRNVIVTLRGHLYRILEVVPTIVSPKQCRKVVSRTKNLAFSQFVQKVNKRTLHTQSKHLLSSRSRSTILKQRENIEAKAYQEGDTVWMWGTKKGEPNNVKGNEQFWLGPFKIIMKSVNDAYYLSTLEGTKRALPVSGRLLKPHDGAKT